MGWLTDTASSYRSDQDFIRVECFSQKRCAIHGITIVFYTNWMYSHFLRYEFRGKTAAYVASDFNWQLTVWS